MISIIDFSPFDSDSDSNSFTRDDPESTQLCQASVLEELHYNFLSSRLFLSRCIERGCSNCQEALESDESSKGTQSKAIILQKCLDRIIHNNFLNHFNYAPFLKDEGSELSNFSKFFLKKKHLECDISEKKLLDSQLLLSAEQLKSKPKEKIHMYERVLIKSEIMIKRENGSWEKSASPDDDINTLSKDVRRLSTLILKLTQNMCNKDVSLSQKIFHVNANCNNALVYCYNLDSPP